MKLFVAYVFILCYAVRHGYALNARAQAGAETTKFSLRGRDAPNASTILGDGISVNSTKAAAVSSLDKPSSISSFSNSMSRYQGVAKSLDAEKVFVQHESSDYSIMMHDAELDPVLVRPNAGKGADNIHVGLIAKNFFGARLKDNRFLIDIVLRVSWNDPRVIGLIPAGLDKLSMAWSQALKHVWMPGVVVANRDIEKYEIISSSVTIFSTGEVVRVERAQAHCLYKFKLEDYPFDTQHIEVLVASSKYMTEEVVLVPNANKSAVEEKVWGLYGLEGWEIFEFKEFDGPLRKSRCSLKISIHRKIGKYFDDHLVPSFIVLAISWAVFYFPFVNPFITPRLALSILALLQFTNLMVKSIKELPGHAPFNWNDLFNQQIQALMFATIILNISCEIIYHEWDKPTLAKAMNHQAKILIPLCSLFNIVIVLFCGQHGWMSLTIAMYLTKVSLVCFILLYASYIYGVFNGAIDTPRFSGRLAMFRTKTEASST